MVRCDLFLRVSMKTPEVLLASDATSSAGARLAVEVRNVSVVYETADSPVHALENIDLDIREGELLP